MTASFSLFQLGPHALAHRVVMAPLTRMRSDPGEVPTPLMATCGSIANRARILLEITEAVSAVWGCGRVGVTLPPRPANMARCRTAIRPPRQFC
jgi:N-ethylmaleimide reductase